MLYETDFNTLNLYLLKKVLITFSDCHCVNGILMNIMPQSQEIMIDDCTYSINSISDIEMVGNITYHTYSNDPENHCDIDGLYFGLKDFMPDTDCSKIRYGEFDCVGACHLSFLDSKITAKDVRIISFSHKIYLPALIRNTYLYLNNNGTNIAGIIERAEGLSVRAADGSLTPISLDNIQDIVRFPQTNDFIEITLKNSNVISGTVSATNDSIIVIIGESVQTVRLFDISSIRYKGVITIATVKLSNRIVRQIKLSLGIKEELFLCKLPYFRSREDEGLAVDGAIATFVPGVTDRGLIAKDVKVETSKIVKSEEEFETGIILIAPTLNRTFGVIGKEFTNRIYDRMTHSSNKPLGTVSFSADQLSFRINHRNAYVVRYNCNKNTAPLKALNIELKETYPRAEYAKIWIDKNGTVQKLSISALFLNNFLKQAVFIETNIGDKFLGSLLWVSNEKVVLGTNAEKKTIEMENILRVFYFGTVTAYQPNNGTGFINGQYWFHVNNFIDLNQILQLEVGTSVKFSLEASLKGNLCAATNIEITDSQEKKGYVLKYIEQYPGKGFGFIITPELLQDRLDRNDRSGTIFFGKSDIKNLGRFKIDTNYNYYLVTFTEGENKKAHNVKFLEEHQYPVPTKRGLKSVPISKPLSVTKQVKRHTETKIISEMVEPAVTFNGEKYEYGLISIFSSRYALINAQYYNRHFATDGNYDINQTVYFNPEEVTIIPDTNIKTGKYTYLVRFVRKGNVTNPTTGLEYATINNDYPVEIVDTFSKKQCASIVLHGETITIEYVEGNTLIQQDFIKATEENDDAPDIMIGESIYFKLKDDSVCHGVYSGENEETYLLSNGKEIVKSTISRLFRFGIISALSLKSGTATINNSFDFSLSVAEPKMVSILKNQKDVVHLHVMYSCVEGKITEVCRVSKRCLSCLSWDAGIVTEFNNQAHSITIDSSITHYLTVLSDGVNTYANNGSILKRAVFVKQVFHPYLGTNDVEPGIVSSAVDVRCQEEELRIQYDEGKDVYLGYRNATISFPVFGSAKLLQEKIGETVLVTFRVSSDMSSLEGYIDDETDELQDNTELIEDPDSAKIQEEALSLLLLQKEDVEQLIADKIYLNANSELNYLNANSDLNQVQRTVDFLISNAKKYLAAIKIAMAYPQFDVLKHKESLFRNEIRERCTAIGLDANSYYGEQAYYFATALQYPTFPKTRGRSYNTRFDFLYRLFSQDFENREYLVKYLQARHPARVANLVSLFRKPCLQVGELIAHIVLLNKLNLNSICSLIKQNQQLSEEIIVYAKEVDDMIFEQDVSEVLRALQDRYLRDKRRFSDRTIELIGKEDNVCEDLKKLLTNMQSRFLKLMCKDDSIRFEAVLKICTDVLGYVNVPGFTRQEQLLQQAYREVGLLEEDILAHPCKESVEILLSSGHFDTTCNILTTLKKDIFSLLNQLYKDASKPRIHVRLNENSILPKSKTFWLIIENGSKNENLQPAENLQIELEPFTLGFMPQTRVRLMKNRLTCGEQLAVEVEFELSGETTGVLEFGWTAHYEYTTEFLSNGSAKKSIYKQDSEHPLQLQIDAVSAECKNYKAENPYFDPARGQPLVGKEMFFGRKTEKQKILDCICSNTGKKHFIPGSAVIIHGQKKSGKTSLVNQIKNYIKEDVDLSDRAILLNFSNILTDTGGVQQLECFQRTFYTAIMSRFKHEIKRCHSDISQMLKDNDIKIPNLLHSDYRDTWPVAFDAFFQDFYNVDNGKHTILLFMDEFTLLCTTILSEVQRFPEKASLNNIPNFIKTFSQYGFIQIIIGHEAMMRALNTLGVLNHTAEFAKSIEISALDDEAARSLVTKPMLDRFGYNVYDSELGKQAIERLLDLSGRNPAYLMRLCNKMFIYYTDLQKCPRTQLLLSDVNVMVQEYIGELLLSDFDILLMEDGDDAVEAEKRITYRYLKRAALLSFASYDKRTADGSEITRDLSRSFNYTIEQIEKARNILEARRVISITNGGRVKINTGLFSEYIQQKNGLR